MKLYTEDIYGDDDAVARWATVQADDYFVSVITDPYEGHAMFHVSVAKKLRAALDRAIQHIEEQARITSR